ncbi:MAG: hypothetical protein Q4D89_14870 [Arachnia propionica]|uniref:hypothetical protein n=1 Tax=Arachnia propionica TaxID=1750 RepID=UPI0026F7E229|nr:hypothetical protein [Arachnia propionica]
MSNLDQEIADALAKVERLRKKKGVAGEKERSRFAEAIMSALDEIEDTDSVSVRALVDRAQAMIDAQNVKRKRAAAKAAASRREAVSKASSESIPQSGWGEER